jgi:hypothetical protein
MMLWVYLLYELDLIFEKGWTPIHNACKSSHEQTIRYLLGLPEIKGI